MQTFQGRVVWMRKLNQDIYWVRINLLSPKNIKFLAGQYVVVRVAEGQERSYSICSNPIEDEYIELCVNTSKNGLGAQYIRSLKKDDIAHFRGPVGSFTVRGGKRPLLFIATGTGITPMRSMLLDLSFRNDSRLRSLLFGVRSDHILFWQEEFEEMARVEPKFDYSIWISQPSVDWTGKCGRVTQGIEKIGNLGEYDVYLCGSIEVVESIKMLLIGQKVDEESIFFEKMR